MLLKREVVVEENENDGEEIYANDTNSESTKKISESVKL